MARIRSVHPGFFDDEDIVEASFAARLLLIGLGVHSDDKGVFPWKAKTLKMRVFPADTIEVGPLLDELAALGLVAMYEIGGKKYGAIRNFRKHQRPKSPNDVHPCPPEILEYVGLNAPKSSNEGEPSNPIGEIPDGEVDPFPPSGEMPIQMEDGGWRMDSLSNDKQVDFDDFWKSWPDKVSKKSAQEAWGRVPVCERTIAARACASWLASWKKKHPKASGISAAKYLDDKRWTDEGFSPPGQVDQEAVLKFYAQTVLSKKATAAATVSKEMAAQLIAAKLVTDEQLIQAGINR